jgi:hypothetical protein
MATKQSTKPLDHDEEVIIWRALNDDLDALKEFHISNHLNETVIARVNVFASCKMIFHCYILWRHFVLGDGGWPLMLMV